MEGPSPSNQSSKQQASLIENLISKLNPNIELSSGLIIDTLKSIREKIHHSKQFYKEFLVKFYSSDGGNQLLEILEKKVEDAEVIDLSISVLATCCLDKHIAEQVRDCSGISIIASVLRHYCKSSVSITNRCARALANLAKNINIEENLEEDVVPILVQALDDTEDSGCSHSLLRILKIFASSKDKTILWNVIDCGGLRVVCKKSKSKDSKLVLLAVETAVALTAPFDKRKLRCALILPIAAANPVLENDSLSNLFDLLSHHKPEVQYHSWECIGNLMSSDIGRAALGNAGFVKFYLATARNEDVKMSVRERCAQYLCLCCQESVNRAKMSELDGLQFLIDLISDDAGSLPSVPSALVVAAITEFRFDASAMEQLANQNLLKILILHLRKKVKALTVMADGEKTSDKEYSSPKRNNRKRKMKRQRETPKRNKLDLEDSDSQDEAGVNKHFLSLPKMVPHSSTLDCEDGLSPQYPARWYPDSPPFQSNSSGCSPSKYYASGLSPPRAHFSTSPPHIHQPIYQFPTSMMSPPKSDTTSPGNSPSYFYDPSSPQKFFAYSEEIFSPVVSEESESNSCSSSCSCDSWDEDEEEGRLGPSKLESKDGENVLQKNVDRSQSGTFLAQATRKLSLSKCDQIDRSGQSSGVRMDLPAIISSDRCPAKGSSIANSSSSSRRTSTSSLKSPAAITPRTSRVSSSPRTSFSGDLSDGERTPCKEPDRHRKHRQEEENIILIFQEMILLHHIPSIIYITNECSIETLLHLATSESVAKDRTHLLLKDILSSRFFYEKLMSHNVPSLIYKSLITRKKQEEQMKICPKQECVSEASGSVEGEVSGVNDKPVNRIQEYLDTLKDVAGTLFGQKEMEHVVREQWKEGKLSAALSLPYIYSSGRILKNLIVQCEVVKQMLHHFQDQSSNEMLRKTSHSLCRASGLLLPQWEEIRDRYFSVDCIAASSEAVTLQTAGDDEPSESRCDECLYKTQEHLSDVSLICKGGEILRASRQLLAARSEYFACLLTGHFQEAGQESVTLGGMQAKSLICMIHSLYDCHPQSCSTLRNLDGESMEGLLDIIAVVRFCMTSKDNPACAELAESCLLEQWVSKILLMNHLVDRTVCKLSMFAALHNCQKLLECCLLFVLGRRSRIRKHLKVLLASNLSDQIKSCIVQIFQTSQ